MQTTITATVPGSIMLMGEHAVLFGELALACAVDKYLHVTLTPNANDRDASVHITTALGDYHGHLRQLTDDPKLTFVLAAIRLVGEALPGNNEKHTDDFSHHFSRGFHLNITSEFSHQVGLGSSAAVTVGTVAVLSAFAGLETHLPRLFKRSLRVVHRVQDGRGSGTDLAASLYGSIIAYRTDPVSIEPLPDAVALPDICLLYAGYKTKTPDVLRVVEAYATQHPVIYRQLYQLMGQVTEKAQSAMAQQDWQQFGQLMNVYHGLMDALGVSDAVLSDLVYQLRQTPGICGAKITGSGLGDCVLGLGADLSQLGRLDNMNNMNASLQEKRAHQPVHQPAHQIAVNISREGLRYGYNQPKLETTSR